MGSSSGFGSTPRNSIALFRLAFATASPHGLTLLRRVTRRPIMQKVRSRPDHRVYPNDHRASTACRHTVSGSLSLPSPGCFSPFPHGTCALSVAREYLALEGGPPSFPQGFSGPMVLGKQTQRGYAISTTGLSPSMADRSRSFTYVVS